MKKNGTALTLTQGEVLRILAIRSGRKAQEIAEGLGFASYTYLSKLYLLEKLKPAMIEKASQLFDVPPGVFETPEDHAELRAAVEENRRQIKMLQLENRSLKAEIALCNARLDECEREKGILEAKKN